MSRPVDCNAESCAFGADPYHDHMHLLSTPLNHTVPSLGAYDHALGDSIAVDLLSERRSRLATLIDGAAAAADNTRRLIQTIAERRGARLATGERCEVRVYGWPMLLSCEGIESFPVRREPALYTQASKGASALLVSKINALWHNVFLGAEGARTLPLRRLVHLNAVLNGDPIAVSRCAFAGASILEGRAQPDFFFGDPSGAGIETGNPQIAVPFLMLAYVATRQGSAPPVPRLSPIDKMLGEQLMSAVLSMNGAKSKVEMFQPRRLFAAIDSLQLEQLWHFTRWSEQRGLNPRIDLDEQLKPTGVEQLVIAQHDETPASAFHRHQWAYDRQWRPVDTQQQIVAEVEGRLRQMRQAATASTAAVLNSIFRNVH